MVWKLRNHKELKEELIMIYAHEYFGHRKKAVRGMASFNVAKDTLAAFGLLKLS